MTSTKKDSTLYWVSVDQGQPQQLNGSQIQPLVDNGSNIFVMSEDQSSGWKTPADFGFVSTATAVAPTTPTAPVAPVAPATPGTPAEQDPLANATDMAKDMTKKLTGEASGIFNKVIDGLIGGIASMAGMPDPKTGKGGKAAKTPTTTNPAPVAEQQPAAQPAPVATEKAAPAPTTTPEPAVQPAAATNAPTPTGSSLPPVAE